VNAGNNQPPINQRATVGVTEVANFYAYDPAFKGGVGVAAGDVTGDGVADIITGEAGAAALRARLQPRWRRRDGGRRFYAYDQRSRAASSGSARI
jgi:hypothetical protein